jgi:hypothetical protein
MRDHLVVGPEGSGTTLWVRLLSQHPGTGWVRHCSFPTPRYDAHARDPDGKRVIFAWEDVFGEGVITRPGPKLREKWPAMSFADINMIDPKGEMMVWVITRDKSCTELSQLRKRHGNPPRSCEKQSAFGRDIELQRLFIEDQLSRREGPVVLVSYETLMQWGEWYMRRKFDEGGLDGSDYAYDGVNLVDGNVKWIADP